MVGQHESLPRTVAGMHEHFVDPEQVDSGDWFRRIGGEIRFKKGMHRGEPLAAVAVADPDYLDWMLRQEDLFEDTRAVVWETLQAAR
jgi:hypothetical protein